MLYRIMAYATKPVGLALRWPEQALLNRVALPLEPCARRLTELRLSLLQGSGSEAACLADADLALLKNPEPSAKAYANYVSALFQMHDFVAAVLNGQAANEPWLRCQTALAQPGFATVAKPYRYDLLILLTRLQRTAQPQAYETLRRHLQPVFADDLYAQFILHLSDMRVLYYLPATDLAERRTQLMAEIRGSLHDSRRVPTQIKIRLYACMIRLSLDLDQQQTALSYLSQLKRYKNLVPLLYEVATALIAQKMRADHGVSQLTDIGVPTDNRCQCDAFQFLLGAGSGLNMIAPKNQGLRDSESWGPVSRLVTVLEANTSLRIHLRFDAQFLSPLAVGRLIPRDLLEALNVLKEIAQQGLPDGQQIPRSFPIVYEMIQKSWQFIYGMSGAGGIIIYAVTKVSSLPELKQLVDDLQCLRELRNIELLLIGSAEHPRQLRKNE